jgi:hypothetical protein
MATKSFITQDLSSVSESKAKILIRVVLITTTPAPCGLYGGTDLFHVSGM